MKKYFLYDGRLISVVLYHRDTHKTLLLSSFKSEFGPPQTIENGFYYDIDSQHAFTPEDFPKIEKKMKQLAKQSLPIERHEIDRQEARERWKKDKEIYKALLSN